MSLSKNSAGLLGKSSLKYSTYYVADWFCYRSLILLLGFTNIVYVPWAARWGRRPVYLFSNLVCCGAYLWSALAKSYGSLMGARILTGIVTAIIETLGPIVATDIIFVH